MDYLNILGLDKESIIVDVINQTKEQLKGLTTDRTCMIYSSYISNNLRSNNIVHRNIDTEKLGYNYSHHFSLVPNEDNYYLIDLTYSQFNNFEFIDLIIDGYMNIGKDELKRYLEIVGKSKNTIDRDMLFFNKGRNK